MNLVLRNLLVSALAVAVFPCAKAVKNEPPAMPKPLLLMVEHPAAKQETAAQTVKLFTGSAAEEVPLEEYLVQVVLSEMPPSFEPEALKAQAVAARTFALKKTESGKHKDYDLCADAACCQAWTSLAALEEKYGDTFSEVFKKVQDAVLETAGEALYYQDKLTDATYFSCSGGSSEAAVAVWGTEVPYLQAVPSPGEEDAPRYASEVFFSAEEFSRILLAENPACILSGSPDTWAGETAYTAGGGVDTIMLGGQRFSGTAVRRLFGLNSTRFTLSCENDTFTFFVLGFGHRVGMSQYGAQNMAKQGFDYRTILQYYYRGAEIKKSSGIKGALTKG